MEDFAEKVYDTLLGQVLPQYCVPGVEDAFGPGSLCLREYERMDETRRRICARLGVAEDADVEAILMSMECIQRELCLKMFYYGAVFGMSGQR